MKKKTVAARKRTQKKSGGGYEIAGIILFCFGLFILISLYVGNTGFLGSMLDKGTHFLFGVFAPLSALAMMFWGGRYAVTGRGISPTRRGVLAALGAVLLLAFIHHFFVPEGHEMEVALLLSFGGIIGAGITKALHGALGGLGTTLCLLCLILVDVLLLTHWSFSAGAQKAGGKAKEMGKKTGQKFEDVAARLRAKKAAMDAAKSAARLEVMDDKPTEFIYKKPEEEIPEPEAEELVEAPVEEDVPPLPTMPEEETEPDVEAAPEVTEDSQAEDSDGGGEEPAAEPPGDIPDEEEPDEPLADGPEPDEPQAEEPEPEEPEPPEPPAPSEPAEPIETIETPETAPMAPPGPVYEFPPLTLLHSGGAVTGETDVAKKAAIIESTLESFGVRAKVVHSSVGPTVTRFELKPDMGVRVSRIEGLSNELAMALEATSIRIEAPIPGKSAVGIEIPNTKAAPVPLRDVLESPEFQKGKGHILVALGKGITGKPVVTDIAKAPHLLIAGSTGSGKSVCINSIITSIIYKYRPDEVKLMLIDPKVVELSVYNGIPHLRTEVVTDMRKAQGTLNWAVREMEARYQLFAGAKVRNIEGYNGANPDKKMPYILIIVDEFADLMNVAAKEVEVLIQRLTQKARAAGIHLILATQRPDATVITGVIKSNIPSRISFMEDSALNSRIVLDEGGAEKLLGKGDMLFKQAGSLHTVRVQGAFISDQEVESVVNFVKEECLKAQSQPVAYEPIDLSVPDDKKEEPEEEEEADELLPEASEWVLDTKRASVSALQRRFRIGYTRAGRLMDSMERLGVVGPADGAKPREILMTKEQLAEALHGGETGSQ